MTDGLADTHALITGAASGIGAACARRLTHDGAQLLLADLNGEGAEALAQELGQASVQVDVTRSADIERMLDTAYQRWGRLDVLFNNAGIAQARPLLEVTEAEWDRMLSVNLRAVFFVLQATAKRMRQQELLPGSELRGKLIQTASIAAYRGGQPYMVHYSASKAGVVSITRTAAQVLAEDKITSNCICPGVVDTPLTDQFLADADDPEALKAEYAAVAPMGRLGTAREIANCILFLASDEASFVTGAALVADGGTVIRP
jgi:NAD(P)-dependent dehydrogenase (short-subunit alcohol dehydrogenase family)